MDQHDRMDAERIILRAARDLGADLPDGCVTFTVADDVAAALRITMDDDGFDWVREVFWQVATLPDGRVFRVEASGMAEAMFAALGRAIEAMRKPEDDHP